MVRACSLDFLNKKEFDCDIILKDGRIVHSMGELVTPEVLLRLYFKEIYVPQKLEFDEEHANRMKDYVAKMGKMLGFSESKIQKLKDAAYFHDIGRTKFSDSDVQKADFEKWQGEAGFNILLHEKGLSKDVAEVASLHIKPYVSARFPLYRDEGSNVPFAHIVAIANRYDELRYQHKMTKKDALDRLVRIGGDRFNIFILHKFVRAMRKSDG